MKRQWLAPLLAFLLATPLLRGEGPGAAAPVGSLLPLGSPDDCRTPGIPYHPQPGDLLLCDEQSSVVHGLYKLVGTGPPCHSSMVMLREDGSFALLDLHGPTVRRAWVTVYEIHQRMYSYKGIILVRRLRQPLHAEQSCALTRFARAQEGKHFATGRVLLQGTLFNARSGLRREWFGHTYEDRHRWFCSELVVAGCCAAGILDPQLYPANAIYPRDLAFDEGGIDISCQYEPAMLWKHEGCDCCGGVRSRTGR